MKSTPKPIFKEKILKRRNKKYALESLSTKYCPIFDAKAFFFRIGGNIWQSQLRLV